jgi:ketosteroid isomerase-like protein
MSSTREVLEQFFDCLRHLDQSIDRIVNLFAEDGVSEFPYLSTLGVQSRFTGPTEIRAVWDLIRSKFSEFTLSKIDIHQTIDPDMLIVEYHAEGTERETGKFYAQDYISRLTVKNGNITLLREYLDVIASARAILPNGLADVPAPKR